VKAELRQLVTRLANLVARGVIRQTDDARKVQVVQVEVGEGEVREVQRVQEYGFTSHPPAGGEAVVVFVGGRRDHGLTVATDDGRYRPTGLEAGEVAVYTDQGDRVIIERGGTVRVTASAKVVLEAPLVELAGSADAVALASKVLTELAALKAAVSAAPVVPGDGGAAFKAALLAALASWPGSVASAKVKAE